MIIWSYVPLAQNFRIFSRRYHFRLWVFASTGEYFYYWHWQVLPNVLQRKYDADAKTFKNLMLYGSYGIILCFVLTNNHITYVWYIADWLV